MSKKPNNIIKDVVVNYCHVGYPVLAYQKKPMEGFPFGNKQYTVDCLLPAATLKKLLKHYKKSNVKSLEKIKDYTAKEYEAAFKVKPPKDKKYMNEDGEYSVMKMTAPAAYNDGEQNTKAVPKIVGKSKVNGAKGPIYKDGEGNVVGVDVAIGNGSLANVHFSERGYTVPDSNSKGIRLQLLGIQVMKLIPYENDEGAFDIEEEESDEEDNDGFSVDDDGDASDADEAAADDSDEDSDDDDGSWDAE